MVDFELTIDKKTREALSKGARIYRIVYGITLVIIGIIIIAKTGFSLKLELAFLGEAMIVFGILSTIYGLIGKELVKQRIIVQLGKGKIKVKKNFEKETLINLDTITYLKISPFNLELSFEDYTKTYNFSYLTEDEFETVKLKIIEYCLKRKIDIEE